MSDVIENDKIDLMPTLQMVNVPAMKLYLDPNNPRFLDHDDNLTDEANFLDPGIILETERKMNMDNLYQIKELEKSIVSNGWQPVDQIFVRKYLDTDNYIVQEGNRRVTAIRKLLSDPDTDVATKSAIEKIDVMEIIDDCDPKTLQIRISYLLGVRHHGSLKKWSAFAQAHNMFVQYIRLSGMTEESFKWDKEFGNQVASALSIDPMLVEQRLKVYRAMKQIDTIPEVEKIGGIKGGYYSLCSEVLNKKGKTKLLEYIEQDANTMLLSKDSLQKMDNLCHFSTVKRSGAPMKNPAEWRDFDKILQDDDKEKREKSIAEVETNKRAPSDVWADRAAELYKIRWETTLLKISQILSGVDIAGIMDNPDAEKVCRRLGLLLAKLDDRIKQRGKD